ncbi:hypothetical protein C0583_04550 [Candidatus Parcubacteria bacterium]|nr:MAG: hypothetical protein C0583_04550 [Candidatus Parcubacteria bacterium]
MQYNFSKFNLYDQIGYLVVGAYAILVVYLNVVYILSISLPFDISVLIVYFIISYILGHVIQGSVNLAGKIPILKFFFKENKKDFNSYEKAVLKKARSLIIDDEIQEHCDESKVWSICNLFVLLRDTTGQIQVFNSNYGLYRGLYFTSFVQVVFMLLVLFWQFSQNNFLLTLFFIFLLFVFLNRANRFWGYLRVKTLDLFLVLYQDKK